MTPTLLKVILRKETHTLLLSFDNGEDFELSSVYLREHSPSADTKKIPFTSQSIAKTINIVEVQPVGHYAIRLVFSDGHQTGLYTWDTLYRLARQQVL